MFLSLGSHLKISGKKKEIMFMAHFIRPTLSELCTTPSETSHVWFLYDVHVFLIITSKPEGTNDL